MPGLFFVLLALAIIAFGCSNGVLEIEPTTVTFKPGPYIAEAYVTATEGNCGWIAKHFAGFVDVDSDAQFVSPLPGTISCTTTYPSGFDVVCKGLGNTLHVQGSISGVYAMGEGEAVGNVGGCKRVLMGVYLKENTP